MGEYLDFYNPNIDELIAHFESIGETPFRAKRLYRYLYREGVYEIDKMSEIPADTREKIKKVFASPALKIKNKLCSSDGSTEKYLFETLDGEFIETVFMRHKERDSICISSQVGCRMSCSFCASGSNGLVRNLSASEMALQIILAEKDSHRQIKNIVLMGIGEPLDNYENMKKFIKNFTSDYGRDFSRKAITISTCGLIPMINALADELPQVNLAISLHASNDNLRNQIMPISKKYAMYDLICAVKNHIVKTRRRSTIEYILIKDFNDSNTHAKELAALLKDMNCIVNLIPLNSANDGLHEGSSEITAQAFREILGANGVPATVRTALGSDIDAACGQLRLNKSGV